MSTHTRTPPYHDPARRALEPIGPELEPCPDEGRPGPEEFQLSGAGAGHFQSQSLSSLESFNPHSGQYLLAAPHSGQNW